MGISILYNRFLYDYELILPGISHARIYIVTICIASQVIQSSCAIKLVIRERLLQYTTGVVAPMSVLTAFSNAKIHLIFKMHICLETAITEFSKPT